MSGLPSIEVPSTSVSALRSSVGAGVAGGKVLVVVVVDVVDVVVVVLAVVVGSGTVVAGSGTVVVTADGSTSVPGTNVGPSAAGADDALGIGSVAPCAGSPSGVLHAAVAMANAARAISSRRTREVTGS